MIVTVAFGQAKPGCCDASAGVGNRRNRRLNGRAIGRFAMVLNIGIGEE